MQIDEIHTTLERENGCDFILKLLKIMKKGYFVCVENTHNGLEMVIDQLAPP